MGFLPSAIGRFYTRGRIIRLDELEQTFVLTTGTRRIICLDELSSVMRLSSRITEDNASSSIKTAIR